MAKRKKVPEKWTLVQHSGYGYNSNPQFARAVEFTCVETEADQKKVMKLGGALFDSHREASDAEETENYPPEVKGLVPRVRGHFAKWKLGGLALYLPKR